MVFWPVGSLRGHVSEKECNFRVNLPKQVRRRAIRERRDDCVRGALDLDAVERKGEMCEGMKVGRGRRAAYRGGKPRS